MRKVMFQMMTTLDGLFEGPNGEIDWHVWSDDMERYSCELMDSVDALLFGRKTYEMMASYWPTATDSIAPQMNSLPKIVFSRTLERADWQNTTLVKDKAAERVANLKELPGKDIAVFGSSELARCLMEADVIDEYRIIVAPVVLGQGKKLFDGATCLESFKLESTRIFDCGNVMLTYRH